MAIRYIDRIPSPTAVGDFKDRPDSTPLVYDEDGNNFTYVDEAGNVLELLQAASTGFSVPDNVTVIYGPAGLQVAPGSLDSTYFDATDDTLEDDDGNTLTFTNGLLTLVTPA